MPTFAAVHAQGCFPKLNRVFWAKHESQCSRLPKLPPCSPAKHLLRVDSSQDPRGNSATGRWAECAAEPFGRYYSPYLFLHQQFAFSNLRDQQWQGTDMLPGLVHAAPLIIRRACLLTCWASPNYCYRSGSS